MQKLIYLVMAMAALTLAPVEKATAAGVNASLVQAAVTAAATKTLSRSLTTNTGASESETNDTEGDGDGDDGDGDGKLGGTWTGTVNFFGDPSLDFDFTWTMTRLVKHFYSLQATRVGDSEVQNGIAAQLTHGRPDVAIHGGFGTETDCRYIYIGESSSAAFAGIVIRRCGTESIQGSFSATR